MKNYLLKATSGGAFGAIARYVIKNNGVVYGCAYCENNDIKHTLDILEHEFQQWSRRKEQMFKRNLLEQAIIYIKSLS